MLIVLKLAKHESMNERKRPVPQSASEIIRPPAFPTPGNNIFERIGTAVSASRGYPLHYTRIGIGPGLMGKDYRFNPYRN